MNFAHPSVEEERWLTVADRYPALRAAAEARAGGWRTPSLLSRVLMFLLGLIAASMIAGSLVLLPGRLLVAGLAMLFLAEWLIRSRRLVAGGIEEALWLCGAGAIVGQLLVWSHAREDALILLVASLTLLGTGLRLGNAVYTTLAALGVSVAIAFTGSAALFGGRAHALAALAWSLVAALGALALGRRDWRRPSHDRMLDGLVVAMPLAAFGWALAQWPEPLRFAAGEVGSAVPALIALGFAVLLASTGLRRRRHAPLIGAMLAFACLAWSLRELTGLPLYGRLMLWGGLVLAVGLALERGLRRPRAGITSAGLGPGSGLEELAPVYGAAALTPEPARPSPGVEGQGGGFGGGGASGRF